MRLVRPALACALLASFASPARAQPLSPELLRELRWRPVGPLRGGRTKAAVGVPQRPGLFFMGAVDGGVFKSDDYGRTWTPIFDGQPSASIGALAVAPSNPDVLYVGSGEGLHRPDLSTGDGLYRSDDGGRTFRHLGLRDAQQIAQIAVDPRDPKRVFVAALGHPYGPNDERGLFRSVDGGETLERVLSQGPDVGASDVVIDPQDPNTVYAVLWEERQAPWENGVFSGPGSGLYKSTDAGTSWRRLDKGLPNFDNDGLGRIGLGIAPSRPSRLFATVQAKERSGLYRSDDAGESWERITDDARVAERGDDFAEVKVHPQDPDTVFTASVVVWKSTDGGRSFVALRGAPGGDDYQRIWIDPVRPEVMLIACDQGAIVTVNGGRTFSSWYNQPTAQMFHVNTDNAFPYRICGGQQDSGSACVSSRGPLGQITDRDWSQAGIEEYGYAVPDPRDPDLVFGGKLTRWDRRTGQGRNVIPEPLGGPETRMIRTQPILFDPSDPRTLYFASNTVWRSHDRGEHWKQISPDLTRKEWAVPPAVGKYQGSPEAKASQRGVVYALAVSPLDPRRIWAGTDDGLLHVTSDGGASWRDVTPPLLGPWAKVSVLEASHFDAQTAWAAINTLRLDDLAPHLLRTRDGGRSWIDVGAGLPRGEVVDVVREDPVRRELVFAGTERGVHASFDGGDQWFSLRQNLPATSVRDLAIHDGDLIAATHGRGFWVLDDLSPLRQLGPDQARAALLLFSPSAAVRLRANTNNDTPLPPDEPTLPNPPDGAVIDYLIGGAVQGEVALEIFDDGDHLVRRFSSHDRPWAVRDEGNVPRWWIKPQPQLSPAPGLHRFVWDLRWTAPAALDGDYPIAAVPGETVREPRGPWAVPGRYRLRLSAGGRVDTRELLVKMDPRVKVTSGALREQLQLSRRLSAAIDRTAAALLELRAEKEHLAEEPAQAARLAELSALEGAEAAPPSRRLRGKQKELPTLGAWHGRLLGLYRSVQEVDGPPTPALAAAVERTLGEARELLVRWQALR